MSMRYVFFALGAALASLPAAGATGVLVVAHGTSCGHGHVDASGAPDDDGGCCPPDPSGWEQAVLDSVDGISTQLAAPVEVAFGMWETEKYDQAIARLDDRLEASLDRLIVIPLFISQHSIVIDMQKYIFRQTPVAPPFIPATQVRYAGRIDYGPTIDYDEKISEILSTRARALQNAAGVPAEGAELVIAMHGPLEDREDHLWRAMGHQYAADLAALGFAEIHVNSLRDDAEPPIRERAAEMLREAVGGAAKRGRKALVLPLLVAPGGIEAGIHERLQGMAYVWLGETLLPDPRIGDYLKTRIAAQLDAP